jgi:hypothetical protein
LRLTRRYRAGRVESRATNPGVRYLDHQSGTKHPTQTTLPVSLRANRSVLGLSPGCWTVTIKHTCRVVSPIRSPISPWFSDVWRDSAHTATCKELFGVARTRGAPNSCNSLSSAVSYGRSKTWCQPPRWSRRLGRDMGMAGWGHTWIAGARAVIKIPDTNSRIQRS